MWVMEAVTGFHAAGARAKDHSEAESDVNEAEDCGVDQGQWRGHPSPSSLSSEGSPNPVGVPALRRSADE